MGLKRRHEASTARDHQRAMSIDEFWDIIERAGQRARRTEDMDGNQERFEDALRHLLCARGPDAVLAFDHHLDARMRDAYHWDLWDAAVLIEQGCGDDGFQDFRAWIISMGREVYEQALHNPDSLAGPSSRPDVEACFFEGLLAVSEFLYEDMTGSELPYGPRRPYPRGPQGIKYDRGNLDLERRFPALWALYGKKGGSYG